MAPPLHKIIQSPNKFSKLVDSFLASCEEAKKTPHMSQFMLEHRLNAEMMNVWKKRYDTANEERTEAEAGRAANHDPQGLISEAIKRLKLATKCTLLSKLDSGAANANAMFMLKACCGLVERQHIKQDVTATHTHVIVDTGVPLPDDSKG